jgi:hypothetical protein
MNRRRVMRRRKVCFSPFFVLLLANVLMGCSLNRGVSQWNGSGFVRKEFLEYKSAAVLPFEGDKAGKVSMAFASSLHEKFPQISIVDRKWVSELLQDDIVTPHRLNEETRLWLGHTLGAQALITGNIYYPSVLRWLLQVVIIDTETGEVLGRSMVEINYMGSMGKEEAAHFAVEKLEPR